MKILFLTEFFPQTDGGEISGGAESRTYYLAKELSQNNEVTVITTFLDGTSRFESWVRLKIYRVGIKRSYIRKLGIIARSSFLVSVLWKSLFLDFDIIDANNGVVYFFAWVIARMKRKKLVYWIPDMVGLPEWQKEQGFLGGLLARFLELSAVWFPADKIIALSETTKKKIGSNNVVVIYPGV